MQEVPEILRTLAPAPSDDCIANPRDTPLCHKCYRANFGRSRSNDTSVITKFLQKNTTPSVPLSTPLKVIGTDSGRSATYLYDFLLLMIYSNNGHVSYRFLDKRQL